MALAHAYHDSAFRRELMIMWWPTRPTSFNARWVAMPSAMTLEMFNRARKAAERPTAMTYTHCKSPNCKRG
jgi:hypothetical protein